MNNKDLQKIVNLDTDGGFFMFFEALSHIKTIMITIITTTAATGVIATIAVTVDTAVIVNIADTVIITVTTVAVIIKKSFESNQWQ